MRHIYDIKSGLLLVHENEISLHKWSVGTAHLRTVEGTLSLGVETLNIETLNIICHRALNVNSCPVNSSHSKIISNE